MSKDARIVHALDRLPADRSGLNLAGRSRVPCANLERKPGVFDSFSKIGFAVLFGIAAKAPAHAETPGLDFNDSTKTVKSSGSDRK